VIPGHLDAIDVLRAYLRERRRRVRFNSPLAAVEVLGVLVDGRADAGIDMLGELAAVCRDVPPLALQVMELRDVGLAWLSCPSCPRRPRRTCPVCAGAGRVPERYQADDEGAVRRLTDREVGRALGISVADVRRLEREARAVVAERLAERRGR
jgi:hypothetical protein